MGRDTERRRRGGSARVAAAPPAPRRRGGGGIFGLMVLLLTGSIAFLPARQEARLKDGTPSARTDLVSGERKWVLLIDLLDKPASYVKRADDSDKGAILEQGQKHWRIDWPVAGGTWGGILAFGAVLYLLFGRRK